MKLGELEGVDFERQKVTNFRELKILNLFACYKRKANNYFNYLEKLDQIKNNFHAR